MIFSLGVTAPSERFPDGQHGTGHRPEEKVADGLIMQPVSFFPEIVQ